VNTIAFLFLAYQVLILFYFLALNAGYTVVTMLGFLLIKRSSDATPDLERLDDVASLSNLRPISVMVPCFNEGTIAIETVRNVLRLNYPQFEILVINDGSTDNTFELLRDTFELVQIDRPPKKLLETEPVRGVWRSRIEPNLWLIDKDNGGKADALNCGLLYSSYPLFCAVDGDSLLEADALLRMGHQFMLDRDLIAAGGAVRVLNGCTVEDAQIKEVRAPSSILANIQIAEYLRGFMAGRVAFDAIDSLLIISGAFGIFRKDLVLAISGFRKTVGEDMDLVLRLHRYCVDNGIPYAVRYVPEPVCWTQVPSDLFSLLGQRNRWQRGLVDCLWHNRVMMLNPKYGNAGMIGMPYFLVVELLGPLIEFIGYAGFIAFLFMKRLDPLYVQLFFVASVGWGMWLNAAAVMLDNFTLHRYARIRDSYKIALLGTFEYLGYRQLLTVERLIGTFQIWRKNWGVIKRESITSKKAEPAK